jgi:hypothetical protein
MDPVVDLYLNTDLTQQQIADQMGFSRKKVKNILLKNGIALKAKRKGIGGCKPDSKWGGLLLESVARKGMTLLEVVNSPGVYDRVLVACPHHPEGRNLLVKAIINSKHCCHAGNAQSPQGRAQRAATLTEMWDDPERKIPLLRNASGHKGAETTKLYICKVLASDNTPVLKFGRSERGAKRFGSHLVKTIWEMECPTETAKLVEMWGHLRFSNHSLKVELNTSGYTECYKPTLPVEEVIDFFEKNL